MLETLKDLPPAQIGFLIAVVVAFASFGVSLAIGQIVAGKLPSGR